VGERQKRPSPHARAPFASNDLYFYDVAPDGKRFLVNRYLKPDHVQPLMVVLNAAAETRQWRMAAGSGLVLSSFRAYRPQTELATSFRGSLLPSWLVLIRLFQQTPICWGQV
jgi:hypothetical protein